MFLTVKFTVAESTKVCKCLNFLWLHLALVVMQITGITENAGMPALNSESKMKCCLLLIIFEELKIID